MPKGWFSGQVMRQINNDRNCSDPYVPRLLLSAEAGTSTILAALGSCPREIAAVGWRKTACLLFQLEMRNEERESTMAKNTICVWYDKDAEAAARFYAATFPDSTVDAVIRAPGDYPEGKQGDVLVVEFTVAGIPCIGLNGGPAIKHNEAFSFQIATDDQEETDRYWNAIVGNGGQESACGWCKDKWGVSWQITPRVLSEALSAGGGQAKRAFDAMMTMRKIDIAAIEAARRG